MSKFDDFLDLVMSGVADLARDTLGDVPEAATGDASDFLDFARSQLEEMTADLEAGELTPDEFVELAQNLKDLAKLVALSRLGIVKTSLERFRAGLIDLVVTSARTIFLPA
jgi:hypothetical protein